MSGKPKKSKKLHVRRADLCKILAISERTLARLEQEAILIPSVRGKGGRPSVYDLVIAVPVYIAHLTQKPTNGTGSVNDARAWRDRSQAQLNDLRVAERRKELLPRAQVVVEGQAFVKAAQAKIRALARRATQLGVPREHEGMISGIVREALEEMARWSTLEDLMRVRSEEPEQTELETLSGDQETENSEDSEEE